MVIAVLVVVWIVALTPTVVRRLGEREPATSVDSFGDGMRALRDSYPYLAFSRSGLTSSTEPGFDGEDGQLSIRAERPDRHLVRASGELPLPRPRAVPQDGGAGGSREAPFGDSRLSRAQLQETATPPARRRVERTALPRSSNRISRRQVARRRRALLSLSTLTVLCFLLSLIGPLSALGYLGVIALGSTVGYVGLLAHYQRRAAERSAKIIYLQSIRPATEDARGLVSSQTTSQENEDRGRERSTRSSRFESADESADRDSHYSGQYRDQYDTAGDEVWYAETGV